MKNQIALAALLLGIPLVAQAQPVEGPYVSLLGGGNFMSNEKLKSIQGPRGNTVDLENYDTEVSMNTGANVRPAVGYSFGPMTEYGGPRVEVEGEYLYNRFDSTQVNGNTTTGPLHLGGYEQKYGVMANAAWDFDFGLGWAYPYIGVGAGVMWSNWNSYLTNNYNGNTNITTDSTKDSFAYQVLIGSSFPIDEVAPGLSVYTGFRFMQLTGNRNYGADVTRRTAGGGTVTEGAALSTSQDLNFSLGFGVRYAFNAAPPPPPPAPVPVAAPAPAPARSYLVFFDWDKADLTDRARQIIAEAAQASTRVQVTRIEVNGYADRTGTAAYNLTLSRRRATNVAAELVKDGVPQAAISIQAFGDTHLLVPTAAGVREPQNRRVEIILH